MPSEVADVVDLALTVESAQGGGSRFVVELPLR
jgi:hypothetical protein